MNLQIDYSKILPQLKRFEPLLVGLALIALFGYTAYVINGTSAEPTAAPEQTKTITFDAKTIQSLKERTVVSDQVEPGSLGKSDPFGQ